MENKKEKTITKQALLEKKQDANKVDLFEYHKIKVDPKQAPIRIDKFLIDRLPNVSRNKLQEAIINEFVRVNENTIKRNYKIRPGDIIRITLPTPPRDTIVIPEKIPLDIIYEDDYLMIVNKPAGMVVHPAYNNWSGTMVNALAWHFESLPILQHNEGRPGIVHRIDKDTSGLLVVAKSEDAINGLAKQFHDHSIERTYYALIWGEPKNPEGSIEVNLGRSIRDRKITVAYPEKDQGRWAVTHYKTLKTMQYVSLVQCKLETGRTHQIRAHMKFLGHPLFNDAVYGGNKILRGIQTSKYKAFVQNCFAIMPRQGLHAKSLGFIHPISLEEMYFKSELPADFAAVLKKWGGYVKNID